MQEDHSSSSRDGGTRVAVCIITYRRPEGLRRLLDALSELSFSDSPPQVEIVVIDNDEEGSARRVCEGRVSVSRWDFHYDIEPRRGIPFARNKAIAYAMQRADLIAFVDDDEAPDPNWLEALLAAQNRYDADVVAGPVVPVLPPEAPAWVGRGRHFDHPRYPSGRRIILAASGNAVIRSSVLRSLDSHFDERLAYCGGSDSLFFRRLHLAGHKMVWADDAIVREWVPASRATAGWLVRRAYRHGTTLARRRLDLYPVWRAIPSLLYRLGIHLAAGCVLLPFGLLRGKHAWVMHLRYLAYAAGVIGGLCGGRYEEYRNIHGR